MVNNIEALKLQTGGEMPAAQADQTEANDQPNQIQKPTESPVEEIGNLEPIEKADWFEVRLANSGISTSMLMDLYGSDGFSKLKSDEDYWKNKDLQKSFNDSYGVYGREKFEEYYAHSKREYAAYKLGQFTKSQTGFELVRDDISDLRTGVETRFENMMGTLATGTGFSAPNKDTREDVINVRIFDIDADGNKTSTIVPYSAQLLKELEDDDSFGGLAYSDAFRSIDPNEGINGVFYDVIRDGKVFSDAIGDMVNVRNDQIVSRWDLETGSMLDGILKNNKLEANNVFDYVKILAKAPINMWANLMDTGIQLSRAAIAGGYGIADKFTSSKLDVNNSEVYTSFTNAGIKWKGRQTSMTTEALTDGFFFSLEAALSTTAEIALQVALARGLSVAGAGAGRILNRGLTGTALAQAEQRYAEVSVRSILTAMATKDAYNEAIETGYSTSEASMITGAMGIALWKATRYASYILGDYEGKVIRKKLKDSVSAELNGRLGTMLQSIKKTSNGPGKEGQAHMILTRITKAVDDVFGTVRKSLPSSQWAYAARQESFEEMTEELYQDIVKHGASAYSYLLNDAHSVGKGRYSTIFDEGYFKQAIERYATSGVAGAMGGPMGMVGNKVNLNSLTSASSLVDIMLGGHKNELVNVLEGMRENGELGPTELSIEYNEAEDIFEPIVQGSEQESLGDMVYNTYIQDINVVDTFMKKGMFGQALSRLNSDAILKNHVEETSLRKDFTTLMGSLLDFHTRTGVSMSAYADLDGMSDSELYERLPVLAKESAARLVTKRAEVERLRATVDKEPSTEDVKDDAKPKTEKKEKTNIIGEDNQAKLTRLDQELTLSRAATNEDIVAMLNTYRHIRAISNGTLSESYLTQQDMADDKVLGAMDNRDSEFIELGNSPILNIMNSARDRYFESQKEHIHKIKAAKDLESKLEKDFADFDTDLDAAKLNNIILRSQGLLTEKALKFIIKKYDKKKVAAFQDSFDIKKEEFLFNNAEGELDREKLTSFVYEIFISNPLTKVNPNLVDLRQIIIDNDLDLAYIADLAKDLDNAVIPDIQESEFNEAKLALEPAKLLKSEYNLLDNLSTIDNPQAKILAKNVLNDQLMSVRKHSRAAEKSIKESAYFDTEGIVRKDISYLFNYVDNNKTSPYDLVDVGLGEVQDLLISKLDNNIFTKKDNKTIDSVLSQIKVKEAIANLIKKYTSQENLKHHIKMLSSFRKNVLDILDFKYLPEETADTTIEYHPYKDFTTLSDYFVDFIYDPIRAEEVLNKKESLYTDADKKFADRLSNIHTIVRDTAINLKTKEIQEVEVDYEGLFASLNSKFENLSGADNILSAAKLLVSKEGGQSILVPNGVLGVKGNDDHNLAIQGVTRIKISEWLFKKVKEEISKTKDNAEGTNYLDAKNKDIKNTTTEFLEVISSIKGLEDTIIDLVPGFDIFIASGKGSDISITEQGAMNIKIEKALYDIYNGNEEVFFGEDYNKETIIQDLDELMESITSELWAVENRTNNTLRHKANSIIGALTTNFTPFYTKLKTRIEQDMAEPDSEENPISERIVLIAAQENAAKYASAWIYSPAFKNKVIELVKKDHIVGYKKEYIESIFISGIAGSGKSSAVTSLGMSIAADILKDRGITTTAVLPVANFETQVEIISKSVGELSEGLEGLTVQQLKDLLKAGILEKDQASLHTLNKLSTVLIDEVTYLNAYNEVEESELKWISNMLKIYNDEHRLGDSKIPISLVIMGDPSQSGSFFIDGVGAVRDTKIIPRDTFNTPYMDFSFRSRNSFLGSSIATIQRLRTRNSNQNLKETSTVIPKGLKYGMLDEAFYGVNVIEGKDVTSNSDFISLLNDKELIKSIKSQIDKDPLFEVLVVPESLTEFNSKGSELHTLRNSAEKYKKAIKIVPFAHVGGSEANYVLAEFPQNLFGPNLKQKTWDSNKATLDSFNTVVTRAKDFVTIVNKNEDIIINRNSVPVRSGEGDVVIYDSKIEELVKAKIRDHYMGIFEDFNGADTEVKLTDSSEDSTPPPGSTPTDLDLDITKLIQQDIEQYLESENIPLKGAELEHYVSNVFSENPEVLQSYIDSLIDLVNYNISQEGELSLLQEEAVNKYEAIKDLIEEKDIQYFLALNNMIVLAADNTSPDAVKVAKFITSSLKIVQDNISKELNRFLPFGDKLINENGQLSFSDFINIFENAAFDTFLEGNEFNSEIIISSLEYGDMDSLINDQENPVSLKLGKHLTDNIDRISKIYSVNTSDTKISDEDYTELMDRLLMVYRAKAVELLPSDFEGFPDISPDNTVLSEVKLWAFRIEVGQLAKVIGDVDKALVDDSVQEIVINDKVQGLLEKYNRESVLENARKILFEVYKMRSNVTGSDNDVAELERLKTKLGFSEITNKNELAIAIKDKQSELLQLLNPLQDDEPAITQQVTDLENLINVWNRLFQTEKMDGNMFGTLFYNRQLEKVEDVVDFIQYAEAAQGKNEMYTVEMNNFAIQESLATFGEDYTISIPKDSTGKFSHRQALNLFNFDGGSRVAPDKLEIRVLRSPEGELAFNIMAVKGKHKYIISKLFVGRNDSVKKAEHRLMPRFKEAAIARMDKAAEIGDTKLKIFDSSRFQIMDFPLSGALKNVLKTRSGGIVKGGGGIDGKMSLEELKQKATVSSNIFAKTESASLIEGDKIGTENLKGGLMVLYSFNRKADINGEDITKQLKQGQVLSKNLSITSKTGSITSGIGVAGVNIDIPFNELKILYEDPKFRLGEYVSDMSLTIQKYIGDRLSKAETGSILRYNMKSISGEDMIVEVKVTPAMKAEAVLMVDGYNNYVKGKEVSTRHSEKLDSQLANILKDKEALATMEVLFVSHAKAMADKSKAVKRASSSISFVSKRNVYKFDINKFLGTTVTATQTIKGLNSIANFTSYEIKPPILSADTNTAHYGAISDLFTSKLAKYIKVSFKDVQSPGFALTSEGMALFDSSLKIPKKKVETFTKEEVLTRNKITSYFDENNTILESKSLRDEGETDIQAIDRLILHQETMLNRAQNLSNKKDSADNKVKIFKNINDLKSMRSTIVGLKQGQNLDPEMFMPILTSTDAIESTSLAINNIMVLFNAPVEVKMAVLNAIYENVADEVEGEFDKKFNSEFIAEKAGLTDVNLINELDQILADCKNK